MTEIEDIEAKIKAVLDGIRVVLQQDKGDVEFVKFEPDTGFVEVRLLGNCKNCPLSIMTLRAGIEKHLLRMVPQIKRVESVK